MKKLIMALALIASMVTMGDTVDTYKFKSTIHVYSLAKQKYVSTSLNGDMKINTATGESILSVIKKDTKEAFVLTNSTDDVYAIITGKKNTVGAALMGFVADDETLTVTLSGSGVANTKTTGCDPCGTKTVCTKIKNLKGSLVGLYDCGCSNGQHYEYDFSCDLPDDRETTECPVWGTWRMTFKSSVEVQ